MTNYKLCLTVSIIALLLTATLNAKEIYKWVDENGTLHFQGSPPQNTKQPVTIKRLPTYEDDYRDTQPTAPYDIEKDKQAARRKNRLTGESGVPFAMINGQPVHGFSPGAYERALGIRP